MEGLTTELKFVWGQGLIELRENQDLIVRVLSKVVEDLDRLKHGKENRDRK